MAQIGNIAQSYLAGLQAPQENAQNKRFADALIQRANAVFQNQLALQRQGQLQGNRLENQKALQRFKVEQQGDLIGQLFGNGNVPPGTTMNVAGFNVPLNPKLTGDEASAVASQNVFVPLGQQIQQKTREGIFHSDLPDVLGNIDRTLRQTAVNQQSGLFTTFDPRLQALQGNLNSIKRYVFGEGGKQLTPFEAKLVFSLINPTGKSDAQYITDVQQATRIIEEKSRAALGGARAVNPFRRSPSGSATTFGSSEEADASGLPPGTIVNVQGRRYQI